MLRHRYSLRAPRLRPRRIMPRRHLAKDYMCRLQREELRPHLSTSHRSVMIRKNTQFSLPPPMQIFIRDDGSAESIGALGDPGMEALVGGRSIPPR